MVVGMGLCPSRPRPSFYLFPVDLFHIQSHTFSLLRNEPNQGAHKIRNSSAREMQTLMEVLPHSSWVMMEEIRNNPMVIRQEPLGTSWWSSNLTLTLRGKWDQAYKGSLLGPVNGIICKAYPTDSTQQNIEFSTLGESKLSAYVPSYASFSKFLHQPFVLFLSFTLTRNRDNYEYVQV